MKLDHRAEIFQNLNGNQGESSIIVRFIYDNIAGTRPSNGTLALQQLEFSFSKIALFQSSSKNLVKTKL